MSLPLAPPLARLLSAAVPRSYAGVAETQSHAGTVQGRCRAPPPLMLGWIRHGEYTPPVLTKYASKQGDERAIMYVQHHF